MQDLWYEVHYAEYTLESGKILKGGKYEYVQKLRIRRRNPPPASISDGEKIRYKFKVKLVLCINVCEFNFNKKS